VRLDEILDALPEVGLQLISLGQHAGADAWGAQIREKALACPNIFDGQGSTPLEAVAQALHAAGVELSDE